MTTPAARRLAFALAAIAIAAATIAAARLTSHAPALEGRLAPATPHVERARISRPPQETRAARTLSPPTTAGDPEALPHGTRTDRLRVRAAVRAFVATFDAYESGRLDRHVRAALRLAASPDLAAELLDRPPRPQAGQPVPPARPTRVGGVRVDGDRAWAIAERRRGGRRSGLALTLARDGDRFVVTRIG